MANVMDRWIRESINAIEVMETRLAEHEDAVEAAMSAIRRHAAQIEVLETSIGVVRDAVNSATEHDATAGGIDTEDSEVTIVAADKGRPRVTAAISVVGPPPSASHAMLRPVPQPPDGCAAATS